MVRPREKVVVVPRAQLIEQDGKRLVQVSAGKIVELPPDAVVAYAEEPPADAHLEVIWYLQGTWVDRDRAVLLAGGKVPAVGIGLCILAKLPLDEFKARCRQVMDGGDVPDFMEWGQRYQDLVRGDN